MTLILKKWYFFLPFISCVLLLVIALFYYQCSSYLQATCWAFEWFVWMKWKLLQDKAKKQTKYDTLYKTHWTSEPIFQYFSFQNGLNSNNSSSSVIELEVARIGSYSCLATTTQPFPSWGKKKDWTESKIWPGMLW